MVDSPNICLRRFLKFPSVFIPVTLEKKNMFIGGIISNYVSFYKTPMYFRLTFLLLIIRYPNTWFKIIFFKYFLANCAVLLLLQKSVP